MCMRSHIQLYMFMYAYFWIRTDLAKGGKKKKWDR